MIIVRHLLKIAILLCLNHQALSSSDSTEIIGCGGFVRSNTDINFKIIQVIIRNKKF